MIVVDDCTLTFSIVVNYEEAKVPMFTTIVCLNDKQYGELARSGIVSAFWNEPDEKKKKEWMDIEAFEKMFPREMEDAILELLKMVIPIGIKRHLDDSLDMMTQGEMHTCSAGWRRTLATEDKGTTGDVNPKNKQ